MENNTLSEIQSTRLKKIETAYNSLIAKKEQWENDLAYISNSVYDMSDFAISRIRQEINSEDNGWDCNQNGALESEYNGILPDLDDLTELIVNALE